MNTNSVAYLINSTPKYFYILELHLVLLRRYAPNLKWEVFLATEEPEHNVCQKLQEKYDVKIIVLEKEYSSFLSSRKRAIELLPDNISIILPMQEDFLLERFIDENAITRYLEYLNNDSNLISVRLMPCPGPSEANELYNNELLKITQQYDDYGFCFQATLWKRKYLQQWYDCILEKSYNISYLDISRKKLEVDMNIAENSDGQKLFYSLFAREPSLNNIQAQNAERKSCLLPNLDVRGPKDYINVGFKRVHKHPNAVYMCPWPYRPTAIIRGVLQPFAKELASREGVLLKE